MKKLFCLLFLIVIFFGIAAILNVSVTTRQGVNYSWHTIRMPLYLKILDFLDRHYNYKALVKRIIQDKDGKEERAMKILKWTYENIRRNPEGMPVIDDHVWHIIVRGYGVDDQYQDVFTTLCNYAGMNAFFSLADPGNYQPKKPLSFVRLESGWSVFDAYNGTYFKNTKEEMADIEDLSLGNWRAFSVLNGKTADYGGYFKGLKYYDYENWRSRRSAIQSPINRLLFWRKNK